MRFVVNRREDGAFDMLNCAVQLDRRVMASGPGSSRRIARLSVCGF